MESQLPYLAEYSKKIRLYLEIVTTLDEETYRWTIAMQKKYNTENFRVSITMWHEGILKQIFSRSDLVLLPSSSSAFNHTKSPNRCMQSLWEGLPVVAYPLPSYMPFAKFCVLSENMVPGIETALSQNDWREKIELGQNYISQYHTSAVIGEKWATLINKYTYRP
jgi:glycosyltransferase involved in cell wall biosynthesis